MNLVYGEIVDVFIEDGMQMGNVRVAGVVKKVALDLVTGSRCGDRVLLCDGVAIGKVAGDAVRKENNVPRDSR
jgi:hydrogenase maturation factor